MINITRVQLNADRWNLNILSKRVATITDTSGNGKVSYFGFETKEKALQFQPWLIENKHSLFIVDGGSSPSFASLYP